MNIRSIKNRANELLIDAKSSYVRIFVIMMLINLIPSVFNENGSLMRIIFFLVVIAFLPFRHGYIVSSLKVARNNYMALKDEDAWVGFTRFQELFPTYFVMDLIIFVIIFCVTIISYIVLMIVFGSQIITIAMILSNMDTNSLINYLLANQSLVFSILLLIVIVLIISYLLYLYFFAVPYLLEEYQMKTMKAIKESVQLLKGHIFDLIKLDLSFLGWIIITAVVETVINSLLGGIPIIGGLISVIVGGLLAIYIYLPKYELSKAIFFEEIAFQRYHITQPMNDVFENTVDDNQGE